MSLAHLPEGWIFERLVKRHPRRSFRSGHPLVDDWFQTKALQHQEKHLSSTTVLLDPDATLVGYFTLAASQVDFGELPEGIARKLPRRFLPIVVLGWLGVASDRQGQGLGQTLLAQALADAYRASDTLPFVALMVDCVDEKARAFYQHFGFVETPGRPMRLFLSFSHLKAIAGE